MPLNSSGTISIGGSTAGQSINLELGRSATASSNLNESTLRTLAGVASGAISLSSFYGKSNGPVFSPDGGANSGGPVILSTSASGGTASITISCSESASWNYTRSNSTAGTPASGSTTATSVTFSLANATTTPRFTSWTVNATANGVTRYWSVQIENTGFA